MSTSRSVRLRVFSLNCWGIRYLSRHCAQRYEMIAELLAREQYDVALLQEVWSEKDYLFLKQALAASHPFAHHFKSGVIGSGLVVLSKHRIQDALLYQYSLNGYPYMIHHGDWFGGKGAGLVVLSVFGTKVHVYVTHLHAEYCRANDNYLPHRTVQAWELLNLIRHTSADADVVILGGDLNMHPQDLGTRLLQTYTGLRDCYTETESFNGCEDGITLIANNPFTKKKDLLPFENGIRIDYILIKGSNNVRVTCESLSTTKGSVPDKPFPFSDHEALTAQLLLERSHGVEEVQQQGSVTSDTGTVGRELVDVVTEARSLVREGQRQTERQQLTALCLLAVGLALLLLPATALPWFFPSHAHCAVSYSLLGLLGALGLVMVVTGALLYVLFTSQLKALNGAAAGMKLVTTNLQETEGGAEGEESCLDRGMKNGGELDEDHTCGRGEERGTQEGENQDMGMPLPSWCPPCRDDSFCNPIRNNWEE